jgi:hypothetical protein
MHKLRKRLFLILKKYEKNLIRLILTLVFSAVIMWLAKHIFDIYLPFATWKASLESVGIISVLFSIFTFWITQQTEKRQSSAVAIARKEEKDKAIIESHAIAIVRLESVEETLRSAINSNTKAIEEVRSHLGRLSAQVQQTEAEAIMQRKIARLEDKVESLMA